MARYHFPDQITVLIPRGASADWQWPLLLRKEYSFQLRPSSWTDIPSRTKRLSIEDIYNLGALGRASKEFLLEPSHEHVRIWATSNSDSLLLAFKGFQTTYFQFEKLQNAKNKVQINRGSFSFCVKIVLFFADTATFVVCPCHTFWPSKIKLGEKMSFEKTIFWEVHFFSPYYYLLCGGSKCPFVTFDTCKS